MNIRRIVPRTRFNYLLLFELFIYESPNFCSNLMECNIYIYITPSNSTLSPLLPDGVTVSFVDNSETPSTVTIVQDTSYSCRLAPQNINIVNHHSPGATYGATC